MPYKRGPKHIENVENGLKTGIEGSETLSPTSSRLVGRLRRCRRRRLRLLARLLGLDEVLHTLDLATFLLKII